MLDMVSSTYKRISMLLPRKRRRFFFSPRCPRTSMRSPTPLLTHRPAYRDGRSLRVEKIAQSIYFVYRGKRGPSWRRPSRARSPGLVSRAPSAGANQVAFAPLGASIRAEAIRQTIAADAERLSKFQERANPPARRKDIASRESTSNRFSRRQLRSARSPRTYVPQIGRTATRRRVG